ncbi:LLM class flavin-dependent oxidoreductase [Rhodobacteraceae bacterium KMM 6894]|nr:LLM class flavin-dependent oxidoreductase [Rhodobacteraceae bacterium KMM 6894]
MTAFSCVLIGDETLTISCGEMLIEGGADLRAVATRDAAVRTWAEAKGLPVVCRIADLGEVAQGFDWLLSIANLRIVPDTALALPTRGAINFHDGPLPEYAGLNTPVWALLNGEMRHGITWHHISAGVDEGDIILQRRFDIAPGETAQSLNARCYAEAMDSFGEVISELASATPARMKQDLRGRRYYGRADLPANAGYLDLTQPAQTVLNMVNGLDFSGYANPVTTAKISLKGQTVLVSGGGRAEGQGAPGAVLATDAGLTVMAGDGALHLTELRDLSGRAVDLAALVQVGDVLTLPALTGADVLAPLAASEDHWRAQLAFGPLAVPLAHTGAGPKGTTRRDLLMPIGLSQAETLSRIAACARLGAGQATGYIACLTPQAAAAHDAAPDQVMPWVPLCAETADEMATALDLAEKHRAFACDLMRRDPALASHAAPDFAVSLTGQSVPGAALTVLPDEGAVLFDTARLSPAATDLLTARLTEALGGATALLPQADRDVLARWNATETPFDQTLTIPRAFEAQVVKTPDAPALTFEATTLSYAELNARANAVAATLQQAGVGPGRNVGLCLTRSLDLIIGALAILKAGGAYVPLDPDYPAERVHHCLTDSKAPVVLTSRALADSLPQTDAQKILIEDTPGTQAENVDGGAGPDNLAYLIYTSGSTGTPKGVMVSHANVSNFFTGMDAFIQPGGVWMAVTSLAFDISVLELFYTLARGFQVVISGDENRAAVSGTSMAVSERGMDFGLYYWGNDGGPGAKKYELLLEGAKFADANGFTALWTPERHFHAFGGPYPNPSVTGAAVAAVAPGLCVRAGSCVAPLHHPARIAEEWAVIDNLTNGKAGIAFASGWQPDDFVLRPENTPPKNKPAMYETLNTVRALWRGEEVAFPTASGGEHAVMTQPRPVSKELPVWVTTAGNPDTWREAGTLGANVLTHLLGQTIDEVAGKIQIYHAALRDAGHDPAEFKVTMMLHTYLAGTRDAARETARAPMKDYLRSAAGLIKQYAWAFPAFKRPKGVTNAFEMDLGGLSDEEMEAILDFAFERYFEDAGLFGTIEDALIRTEQLKGIGVDEIACLIDYGIDAATVLEGLKPLAEVLHRANAPTQLDADDFSLAAQIVRHNVTHLQCTPSMARLIAMNHEARMALGRIKQLFVGGEALPGDLAADLTRATRAEILNMYGPTETTIWSSVQKVTGHSSGTVPIGAPIANTTMHILNEQGVEQPIGVPGALWIGGAGVTPGYWQRDAMTAERYRDMPGLTGRLYDTGDLAAWGGDGALHYIGRADTQVKIRGQRIELGEIETCLTSLSAISEAVVTARPGPGGDAQLVGYYTGSPVVDVTLRAHLAQHLPAAMVPTHLIRLDRFPLTPNKKIDRKALPAPETIQPAPEAANTPAAPATGGTAGRIVDIWRAILGVQQIGARANFFDLGGHSLLAVQAHRDIRAALPEARLTITDIFRFPVLADLAAHIDARIGGGSVIVAPEPDTTAPDRAVTMSKRRAMRAGRGAKT